jgi:hypothetical protein
VTGLVVGVLWLGLAATSEAALITYEAVNLDDATAGEDLWQYRYRVSELAVDQFVAFEPLFQPGLYSTLTSAVSPDPAWDVLTFDPDVNLPDAGWYSAMALTAGAPLVGMVFAVDFVWLGGAGADPGEQSFDITQYDEFGGIVATLDSGTTQLFGGGPGTAPGPAPVPEPSTIILLGTALSGIAARRRLASRKGGPR